MEERRKQGAECRRRPCANIDLMSGTHGTDRSESHTRRRHPASRVAVAVVASAALLLSACGSDDGEEPAASTTTEATTTTGDTTTSSSDPTPTSDPSSQQDVRLYFTRDEVVGVAGRTLSASGIARATLESLLAGPNEVEADLELDTEIPDGTEVLSLDIADGIATVDLNGAFQSGGGSLSMSLRVAQVVFTLTQFDTVETVNIRIDGDDVDGIGGEGVPSTELDRSDFEDQSPAILVESPTPGADVSADLEVSGTSNTFEATYQWAILDGDDEILEQDFGTASSGTGTRGTWSFEVDLGDYTGPATVKVYESSAKDGSEINVVIVPVTVG